MGKYWINCCLHPSTLSETLHKPSLMPTSNTTHRRYFLTYSGVALPLNLLQELSPQALRNRNTYFQADYDAAGRMLWLEKRVYGEVDLRHDYEWTGDGLLAKAIISTPDEEPQVRFFLPAPAPAEPSQSIA